MTQQEFINNNKGEIMEKRFELLEKYTTHMNGKTVYCAVVLDTVTGDVYIRKVQDE
jgi:hypothetical protein